jgi:hypothetical protein
MVRHDVLRAAVVGTASRNSVKVASGRAKFEPRQPLLFGGREDASPTIRLLPGRQRAASPSIACAVIAMIRDDHELPVLSRE